MHNVFFHTPCSEFRQLQFHALPLIWYLGLEGLGGLDMDTDEEEDVGRHFT